MSIEYPPEAYPLDRDAEDLPPVAKATMEIIRRAELIWNECHEMHRTHAMMIPREAAEKFGAEFPENAAAVGIVFFPPLLDDEDLSYEAFQITADQFGAVATAVICEGVMIDHNLPHDVAAELAQTLVEDRESATDHPHAYRTVTVIVHQGDIQRSYFAKVETDYSLTWYQMPPESRLVSTPPEQRN